MQFMSVRYGYRGYLIALPVNAFLHRGKTIVVSENQLYFLIYYQVIIKIDGLRNGGAVINSITTGQQEGLVVLSGSIGQMINAQ